jgi:hypothetical protein
VKPLILLPLAAVATALVLTVMSVLAKGAANGVGYDAWTPVAGGLIFAVPLLVAGVVTLVGVWQRTRRPYLVKTPGIYFGALGLIVWIAIGLAYVLLIGTHSTYEGEFNQVTQRFDPLFNEHSFIIASLVISLFYPTGISILATWYFFLNSIVEPPRQTVEGVDPIGTIARGQR